MASTKLKREQYLHSDFDKIFQPTRNHGEWHKNPVKSRVNIRMQPWAKYLSVNGSLANSSIDGWHDTRSCMQDGPVRYSQYKINKTSPMGKDGDLRGWRRPWSSQLFWSEDGPPFVPISGQLFSNIVSVRHGSFQWFSLGGRNFYDILAKIKTKCLYQMLACLEIPVSFKVNMRLRVKLGQYILTVLDT